MDERCIEIVPTCFQITHCKKGKKSFKTVDLIRQSRPVKNKAVQVQVYSGHVNFNVNR